MNTEEVWTHIERYLLERNWTGVVVMADALQELGEERLAGTLRWISKVNKEVHCKTFSEWKGHTQKWHTYMTDEVDVEGFSICDFLCALEDYRRRELEYWT